MANLTKLPKEKIDQFVASHPEWSVEEGKLVAQYTLATFEDAMQALQKIAVYASELNHHPEIYNIYTTLRFTLSTHDAGDVITEKDVALAGRISDVCSDR